MKRTLLILVFLAACVPPAALTPVAPPQRAFPVAASRAATWDAALSALDTAQILTIASTDPVSGLILGRPRILPGDWPADAVAACPRWLGLSQTPDLLQWSIRVAGDSDTSTLFVNIHYSLGAPDGGRIQCTSLGFFERHIAAAVMAGALQRTTAIHH